MRDSKTSKLKGAYSPDVSLIFQSWLKDLRTNVEDHQLTQKEAVQLMKDFTTKHAQAEVEFYLSMEEDIQQHVKA